MSAILYKKGDDPDFDSFFATSAKGDDNQEFIRKGFKKLIEHLQTENPDRNVSKEVFDAVVERFVLNYLFGSIIEMREEIKKLQGIIDLKNGDFEDAKEKWEELGAEKEKRESRLRKSKKIPEAYPKIKIMEMLA
jgi:hypothetical protein